MSKRKIFSYIIGTVAVVIVTVLSGLCIGLKTNYKSALPFDEAKIIAPEAIMSQKNETYLVGIYYPNEKNNTLYMNYIDELKKLEQASDYKFYMIKYSEQTKNDIMSLGMNNNYTEYLVFHDGELLYKSASANMKNYKMIQNEITGTLMYGAPVITLNSEKQLSDSVKVKFESCSNFDDEGNGLKFSLKFTGLNGTVQTAPEGQITNEEVKYVIIPIFIPYSETTGLFVEEESNYDSSTGMFTYLSKSNTYKTVEIRIYDVNEYNKTWIENDYKANYHSFYYKTWQ